jgi:hypothetical protein
VGEPCKAIDRISTQFGKLLALASKPSPDRASIPVATRRMKEPAYQLMHSMTWDEDGELDIR